MADVLVVLLAELLFVRDGVFATTAVQPLFIERRLKLRKPLPPFKTALAAAYLLACALAAPCPSVSSRREQPDLEVVGPPRLAARTADAVSFGNPGVATANAQQCRNFTGNRVQVGSRELGKLLNLRNNILKI